MISLPKDSTPATLEEFLREIRAAPGQSLRLPVTTERGGVFGFSALAIQAVLTWARLHPGPRVLHVAPSYATDESTRTRFAASPYGMGALYFAQEVRSGATIISRNEALNDVAPHVNAMQTLDYRSTVRGAGAFLCCFQGARNEFLNALYIRRKRGTNTDVTVRGHSGLTAVLSNMLEAAQTGLSKKIGETHLSSLSALVYQLFNNADIHTAADESGNIYESGLRGIQLRLHRFTGLDDIENYVRGDAKLANYLMKVAMLTPNRAKGSAPGAPRTSSTFIEVSVFDSGPGLSLRWLAAKRGMSSYADMTLSEELEGVRKCFELHSTTQSSGFVGDGLVIARRSMVHLKAFMALRTGRLSLIQDFSSKDQQAFNPQHRFVKTPLLSEIAGASYTICFPTPN